MKASQVATVHNVIKEMINAYLTLVHVFHMNASMNNLWVAHALSLLDIHEAWKDSFCLSNARHYKFLGPHTSCMRQYIIKLAHPG
jgi:hypothetical protein